MPHKSRKKADRNCSGAKGSEAFFSSFLGLQVPVSQNRLKRSKSPKKKSSGKMCQYFILFKMIEELSIQFINHEEEDGDEKAVFSITEEI